MTNALAAPATGFLLEQVSTIRQSCEVVDTSKIELTAEAGVDFGWDWRWLDVSRFEVALTLTVKATTARPEVILVTLIGRFAMQGTPDKVAPQQFAHGHAPAILFPFLRQVVATLTAMSPFGAHLLPPLNVAEIMKQFDPSRAVAANQQQTA